MGVQIGNPRTRRSPKIGRLERRKKYNELVWRAFDEEDVNKRAKIFDEMDVDCLIEFFSDCYTLYHNSPWIREDRVLCNHMIGRLHKWYGSRGAMNYIMASFYHRTPPLSITWYNSPMAREFADQKLFNNCLTKSKTIRVKWDEMHNELRNNHQSGLDLS